MAINKKRKIQTLIFALLAVFVLSIYSCGGEDKALSTEVSWGERPTDSLLKEKNDVIWASQSKKISDTEYEVYIHAWLSKKWHVYSQTLGEEGPLPSEVAFDNKELFSYEGLAEEVGVETHFDPVWGFDIAFYSDEILFKQKIKVINPDSLIISGNVYFMMCDDVACKAPTEYLFEVDLAKGIGGTKQLVGEESSWIKDLFPKLDKMNLDEPVSECGAKTTEETKSNWRLFLLGLLGGLVSLITPCVFPMIPLTVSFFTKGGKEKGKGIGKAVLYGLSIIAVYVALSLPFYAPGADPEMLNKISTGAPLNIAFFVVFIVFAISFFGYYEIGLPSSWANKADKAADVGGFIGIVFMALVLAIVSFSCTGPLLGSVLAGSLQNGPVPVTMAMLGFGVGLGLPFTIFAAFPALLKSLPQSGGWLNTVKVVLGFVELGLALKFLSNADFVYRAGIVHRETFFLIWTILSFATAAYLFGLFKFPHDSKNAKIGNGRKVIAMIFLLFGIYSAPGVIPEVKQPWKFGLVSGFPPPTWYSWYEQNEHKTIENFVDANSVATTENKMLMLDFTGNACVNCRKMEENVWTIKEVGDFMEEHVVISSLYVDAKESLEKPGLIEVPISATETKLKKIESIGDVWSTFETLTFKQASQPYYVLLHPDGTLLSNPVGYTPDSDEYLEWLECGQKAFDKYEASLKKK